VPSENEFKAPNSRSHYFILTPETRQAQVEEALRVEAEREKERQHKAEMMRKTLMMEQHQRAIRKLEQARTNP
jgi:hypothetical protein